MYYPRRYSGAEQTPGADLRRSAGSLTRDIEGYIFSYFLCLDTNKVSKEKSRLRIFLGYGFFGQPRALQLSRHIVCLLEL